MTYKDGRSVQIGPHLSCVSVVKDFCLLKATLDAHFYWEVDKLMSGIFTVTVKSKGGILFKFEWRTFRKRVFISEDKAVRFKRSVCQRVSACVCLPCMCTHVWCFLYVYPSSTRLWTLMIKRVSVELPNWALSASVKNISQIIKL